MILRSALAVLAVCLAADAAAQEAPLATINGWHIFDHRGYCSAATAYDGNVRVRVAYSYPHDRVLLLIANPAWESVQDDATYSVAVTFDNGSDYSGVEATGIRIDNENGRITGVQLDLDGSDFVEDFALAAAVEFRMEGVLIESLSLRGTREVATRLARCAAASARRNPGDPFRNTTPRVTAPAAPQAPASIAELAAPRAGLASYIGASDYPAEALRRRLEGTTMFELSIGANGIVTSCAIVSSSGHDVLDNALCRILSARARFTPARDSAGNPVPGTYASSYTWRLSRTAR